MLTSKYVSSKMVLEKAYSDYPFRKYNIYDAMNWIVECIDMLGIKMAYITKTTGQDDLNPVITVSNYKGELPCDLHKIITCQDYCTGKAMRATTSRHFMLTSNSPDIANNTSDLTYELNDNYIYPNFENGQIAMTYLAYPLDEDGWIKIPDDVYIIRACTDYVVWRQVFKLYLGGEIAKNIKDDIEQELSWNLGAANYKAAIPSIDQMESLKNQVLRLNPKINEHSANFAYLGEQEQRYVK